jgi:hypothetical protein
MVFRSGLKMVNYIIAALVAIALHFSTGFLVLFGVQEDFSTGNLIMNFSIFLQEMVMAFYLIIRGFRKEALVGEEVR